MAAMKSIQTLIDEYLLLGHSLSRARELTVQHYARRHNLTRSEARRLVFQLTSSSEDRSVHL